MNTLEEHVIPESLGNKKTLYRGSVCTKCNHSLGKNVDSKIFNEALNAAGQVSQEVEGKKGVRGSIGEHVSKSHTGILIQGATSGKKHEFIMARAIAKCGVNIFTNYFGSQRVREEMPELIQYVREPKSRKDIWPYACVFTPTGGFDNSFGIETKQVESGILPIYVVLCASGIYVSAINRNIPDIEETCLDYIDRVLKYREHETGKTIFSVTYAAKNNQ